MPGYPLPLRAVQGAFEHGGPVCSVFGELGFEGFGIALELVGGAELGVMPLRIGRGPVNPEPSESGVSTESCR